MEKGTKQQGRLKFKRDLIETMLQESGCLSTWARIFAGFIASKLIIPTLLT